jgi:molybdopterin synthase catalytic subunit
MVRLAENSLDLEALFAGFPGGGAGATVTFEGIVRPSAKGRSVTHLFYEAFPPLAISEMESIEKEATERWSLHAVLIAHRIGAVQAGETSVLVGVASSHRAEAFDACRYIIDALKQRVPIWKKEYYEDGAVWVEAHP